MKNSSCIPLVEIAVCPGNGSCTLMHVFGVSCQQLVQSWWDESTPIWLGLTPTARNMLHTFHSSTQYQPTNQNTHSTIFHKRIRDAYHHYHKIFIRCHLTVYLHKVFSNDCVVLIISRIFRTMCEIRSSAAYTVWSWKMVYWERPFSKS